MQQWPRTSLRVLSAALLLTMLGFSSLSCTTITRLWATPTLTPTPTITPTPEAILSSTERADYLVILRTVDEEVRIRFTAIRQFLHEQGYEVGINEGKSDIGNMDVIMYGALSCLDAIDDLTIILQGKLEIRDLDRVRFNPADLYYKGKHIVIQINDAGRFGPE
jgi:hypothetical protein